MDDLEAARRLIEKSRLTVALTGAGMSAESGIPTFRGAGGLWRTFRAEDLATPKAFRRDPQLVWEWYDWRRSLIAAAEPNAGHRALAAARFRVVTQNVDGLHERAGSEDAIRLHGDIWTLRCTQCSHAWRDLSARLMPCPPRCARCGGMARPGVVWFGESLPAREWSDAETLVEQADVVLVIGTSATVYPAAMLIGRGRTVIEINVDATPATIAATVALRGPAAELLPALLAGSGRL